MAARKSSAEPMSLTATCGDVVLVVIWWGAPEWIGIVADGMKASAYARDRQLYASHVTSTNPPGHGESVRASRMWWDSEATDYHHHHGDFLGAHSADGEFVWCPEGMHEGDWHLLGDVEGRDVLEIGSGS